MYTVDEVVVWAWLAVFYKEITQSQHFFTTVTGSSANTGSFWTVTDREPGLSTKYGNVSLTFNYVRGRNKD